MPIQGHLQRLTIEAVESYGKGVRQTWARGADDGRRDGTGQEGLLESITQTLHPRLPLLQFLLAQGQRRRHADRQRDRFRAGTQGSLLEPAKGLGCQANIVAEDQPGDPHRTVQFVGCDRHRVDIQLPKA
jgi:hypothetical protein